MTIMLPSTPWYVSHQGQPRKTVPHRSGKHAISDVSSYVSGDTAYVRQPGPIPTPASTKVKNKRRSSAMAPMILERKFHVIL